MPSQVRPSSNVCLSPCLSASRSPSLSLPSAPLSPSLAFPLSLSLCRAARVRSTYLTTTMVQNNSTKDMWVSVYRADASPSRVFTKIPFTDIEEERRGKEEKDVKGEEEKKEDKTEKAAYVALMNRSIAGFQTDVSDPFKPPEGYLRIVRDCEKVPGDVRRRLRLRRDDQDRCEHAWV